MYKHILIPTDGSKLSETAVKEGMALASSIKARVTGLTVIAPFHTFVLDPEMVADTPEQYQKDSEARARRCLAALDGAAKAAGVGCETLHVVHEHPYEAIIDTARQRGCDLILMASHGRRGVSAVVLGSETVKVLTHSKIPVLVCR